MKIAIRALCATVLVLASATSAYAGITVNATRVIYPADKREVSLSLVNDGKEPRLIQAWVDSGDASERADTAKAPFVVTPPMSRVDPGKGQALRIMFTGGKELAADRETVFWLNILEVPPKPKADASGAESYMQLAVRSRLKVFYRPKGLPGSAATAVEQIQWRLVAEKSGYVVECNNGTPYNVSFSDVSFKGVAQQKSVSKGGMCPAEGKQTFPVSGAPSPDNTLVVSVINDYGGFNPREVKFDR